MRQVVKRIALTVDAPIQIDSTEPDVLKTALEQIPGRAIVNSINLEAGRDKLDLVVPLAKAHGAAIIALTIDEVGHGEDARAQARDRPAHLRPRGGRARHGRRGADLRPAHVHAHHRRRGVAAVRGRDDRGHPADQVRAARREDLARRLQRLLRRLARGPRGAQLVFLHHAVEAGLDLAMVQSAGRHAVSPRSPTSERELADDLVFNRREDALERFIAHFEAKGEQDVEEEAHATDGMEPEEALHWHILRRKKEGVEDQIDRARGQDRRRPDAERGAAARDEGGRRQVRRRRADPAVRAPVGHRDEAGRRPAREVPRQDRGLHQGHGRAGDGVRRRARHRQVAREHDPHEQRLHGGGPRQAGADLADHRRRGGAQRHRHRALRAARLHVQADADLRGGAARARPRVPGARRRRGDQPRLRPPHPLPQGPGVGRDLRARRLLLQGRLPGPLGDGQPDRRGGARRADRALPARGAGVPRAAGARGGRGPRPTPRPGRRCAPTWPSRARPSGACARCPWR